MEEFINRRRLPRFACTGTVEVFQDGRHCGWGTVSEIARGGCYIETNQPLPPGSKAQLRLAIHGAVVEIGAQVAWMTPQVGMGMRFEATSPEVESAVLQVLSLVTGEGDLSASATPEEFALPQSADDAGESNAAGLDLFVPDGIRPEAAPGILTRIIHRINQSGVLTRQELFEIVKASE